MKYQAFRYVFALLAIAPFAFKKLSQISRSDWPWIMVVTFVGTGFPGVIYPTAVQYVDSSVIGIINALTPLFTLCIGLAIFRLRLTLFKGLGVLLGLLGATLLILVGSPSAQTPRLAMRCLLCLHLFAMESVPT